MDSKRPFLDEDLSCPVCHAIFKDPVMLTCSHSACKQCLTNFWSTTTKETRECPICKKKSKDSPLPNLTLKNVCEAFLQERKKRACLCSQHNRNLDFYCLEDKEPVCLLCRDSHEHKHHTFSLIGEIAAGFRKEIMVNLLSQRNNLKDLQDFELTCEKMADHIERQALLTEQNMKAEFEKLHKFLQDHEAARMVELQKDQKFDAMMMDLKVKDAAKDINEFTLRIRETEEDLAADDASFLLNYQRTKTRTEHILWVLRLHWGDLVDIAKHLGNVKFNAWEKMQEVINYTPVVLDPNTAHPNLQVSADLSSVEWDEEPQHVPHNPERFLQEVAVLGKEGFRSGTHCWDVVVEEKSNWILGVLGQSSLGLACKGLSHDGLWYIKKDVSKYTCAATPQQEVTLKVKKEPRCVRVLLDLNHGKVTFSDPERGVHLQTFKHSFNDVMFPYFSTQCTESSLQISPVGTTVTIQKLK